MNRYRHCASVHLRSAQGFLSFDDRRRASDFATRLEPINFELQKFTTGVEGGRFSFSGVSKLGERVEWHGHIAVQPIESDGEFQIAGLQAHTIWEYLEDQLNFQVNSGKIDVNATYKFALKDDVDLKVDVSKVALTDLAVRPKNSDVDWITVPELILSGTTLDLKPRRAHSESLSITGVKLLTWLEPDGSVNLLKLAAMSPAAAAAPARSRCQPRSRRRARRQRRRRRLPAASHAQPQGAAWQFELGEFALRDASISAEDRRTKPAAKVLLAPLSIKVTGASLELAKPVSVTLDAKINDTGTLNVAGDITPQPVAANLNLKLGRHRTWLPFSPTSRNTPR